jgi:hypothetical protein
MMLLLLRLSLATSKAQNYSASGLYCLIVSCALVSSIFNMRDRKRRVQLYDFRSYIDKMVVVAYQVYASILTFYRTFSEHLPKCRARTRRRTEGIRQGHNINILGTYPWGFGPSHALHWDPARRTRGNATQRLGCRLRNVAQRYSLCRGRHTPNFCTPEVIRNVSLHNNPEMKRGSPRT